MATNYPTSLDTSSEQPSPGAATEMDDAGFEHDVVHTNHSGAIIALETKVGIGSSTPVTNSVLAGSAAGVSGWTSTPTLSSVTADLVGNADTATLASTATALATARNINGVAFDGTGDITVAAAAGTLTGATLASGVTASSLTSVGTLTGLTVSGACDVDEVRADNGSSTDPSFTFTSDQDTGVYLQSGGAMAFATAGSKRFLIYSGGLRMNVNGSAGTPGIHWEGDTDTGIYVGTANQLSLTSGGTTSLTTTGNTVVTATPSTGTTTGYNYVLRNLTFGSLYRFTSTADVKEQISTVSAADAGQWIDALRPVTFVERWLGEGEEPADNKLWREADLQVGFIAEEVLEHAPQFAQVEDVDGQLKAAGWRWPDVIAALVAEVQSLRARVAELEAG